MSEETQPLTGAQALHAAQVMAKSNEEALDRLMVANLEIAMMDHGRAEEVLKASRAALLSRLATLRAERDDLRTKLEAAQ